MSGHIIEIHTRAATPGARLGGVHRPVLPQSTSFPRRRTLSGPEQELIRDDQFHRNIMRLRIDGVQLRVRRGDPDPSGRRVAAAGVRSW